MMKLLLLNRKKSFQTIFVLIFMVSISLSVSSQSLLPPSTHPKFVNPLPIPAQIIVKNGGTVDMYMEQTQQWLGLVDNALSPLNTTVWGYGPMGAVTYPGPTFIAKKNVPVYINWYNNLPGHFLPIDASLHMAHPSGLTAPQVADWYAAGNVPVVPHLHGGHTESESDGIPEAWFTHDALVTGNTFVKTNYVYHNDQEAATLWYHDHALGITRLNVYAGLAGFYLLEDNRERMLAQGGVLPKQKHDIEIVIQDRMFDGNGELFWPAYPDEGPYNEFIYGEGVDLTEWPDIFPDEGPSILAEFFGDYIVVNGTVWPYLDVEPRPYRFRLLNGSDSRFYILKLFEIDGDGDPVNGEIPFIQVATDDGLLPNAVGLEKLLIAPGERAEIVVDFSSFTNGESVRFLNFGPDEPFKGFNTNGTLSDGEGGSLDEADPSTTGKIMQFNVIKRLKTPKGLPKATVEAGDYLRDPLVNLGESTTTRKLGLFEGSDEYGRLQPLLGALNNDGNIEPLMWDDAITENPGLNDVEIWEVYNFTADAHPIHLHLVAFQIIGRAEISGIPDEIGEDGVDFSAISYDEEDLDDNVADNEKGWKDTFIVPPGWVGVVKAKFDRPGRYVWHCHILSHEDHEMMRPYHVGPITAGLKSESVGDVSVDNLAGLRLYPNPMSDQGFAKFALAQESNVSIRIFDLDGRLIQSDNLGLLGEGSHTISFPVDQIDNGLYIVELTTGKDVYRERMVISR
jgi:spore coat protein A